MGQRKKRLLPIAIDLRTVISIGRSCDDPVRLTVTGVLPNGIDRRSRGNFFFDSRGKGRWYSKREIGDVLAIVCTRCEYHVQSSNVNPFFLTFRCTFSIFNGVHLLNLPMYA